MHKIDQACTSGAYKFNEFKKYVIYSILIYVIHE